MISTIYIFHFTCVSTNVSFNIIHQLSATISLATYFAQHNNVKTHSCNLSEDPAQRFIMQNARGASLCSWEMYFISHGRPQIKYSRKDASDCRLTFYLPTLHGFYKPISTKRPKLYIIIPYRPDIISSNELFSSLHFCFSQFNWKFCQAY